MGAIATMISNINILFTIINMHYDIRLLHEALSYVAWKIQLSQLLTDVILAVGYLNLGHALLSDVEAGLHLVALQVRQFEGASFFGVRSFQVQFVRGVLRSGLAIVAGMIEQFLTPKLVLVLH